MLLAAVLTLTPLEAREAPATHARALHAWLLARIADADPALARDLHDGSGPRPFTVSELWGLGRPLDGRVLLDPARAGTCRFTALDRRMADALQRALPQPGETLALGGDAAFAVASVATTPEQHRLAGSATYADLVQRYTLSGAEVARSATLRFSSPTLFRQNRREAQLSGRELPLPLPELVFGSYLSRWNAFAPLTLPPDAKRYASECITLGRFALRSRFVSFESGDKGAGVGCVGRAEYRYRVYDPYWMRVMNLLAHYAFWSGTGYRTTAGFGQTECLA